MAPATPAPAPIKNSYDYSYSGADCQAYAFFPGSSDFLTGLLGEGGENDVKKKAYLEKAKKPVVLSSMATISLSIHEAKSPVRRLGERGIAGVSRSLRTIAGSIVFLVLKDHPLRELALIDPANVYPELIGYSRDLYSRGMGGMANASSSDIKFVNKVSTLISPFNILLNYSTEVNTMGESASLMIEGIDIISEGMVTSVNDMVSEVVVQFIAQNVVTLTHSATNPTNTALEDFIKSAEVALHYQTKYKQYYNGLVNKYKQADYLKEQSKIGTQINIEGYK
jgi:hypothetical protein